MYQVVEFDKDSGGGIGIVRDVWMTPRKKETFWPPFKISSQFNRALSEGQEPDNTWATFKVVRIFYSTDDLQRAREKEKLAVDESDVQTDSGTSEKRRKRRPNRLTSSDDEIVPNKKTNLKKSVVRRRNESSSDEDRPTNSPNFDTSDNEIHSSMARNLFDAFSTSFKDVNVPSSSLSKSSEPSTKQPAATFPLDQTHGNGILPSTNVNVPSSSLSKSSEPSTEQPAATFPLDQTHGNGILPSTSTRNGNIDAIARLLVKLNDRMTNLENIQKEILERLTPANIENTHPLVSIDATLPCSTVQEVEDLDKWLANEENVSTLTKHLSLVGGKKPANVTRRILERLFTNQVAALYNWTGKNQKLPLKDMAIMKLLPGFVRKNKRMEAVSDDEVYSTSSQWFRFTKDREGGREKRRSNARPNQ